MPHRRKRRKKRSTGSADNKGPARAIIEQCPHRMVGALYCTRLTLYPAEWEAPQEQQLIALALMCHDISSIESQPEELPYEDDLGAHTYTPDLAITCARGRILIENKPLRYLITKENLDKYLAIARSLRKQGKCLEFITDDQLPSMWHKNANLLRRYLRAELPVTLPADVTDAFQAGPCTFEELVTKLGPTITLADLYAFVAHRLLCIDWNERLGRRARVSLPDNPDSFPRLTYDTISHTGRYGDLLAEMALGRRPPDQRLLAASQARRRPLSVASPLGFVDGLTPGQLGHLERQRTARAVPRLSYTATGDHSANQPQSQPTEDY